MREAVALVARELMEGEISAEIGAEHGELAPERVDASQRLSAAGVGDAGRGARAAGPQEALGAGVLPVVSGAAAAAEQAIVAVVMEAYVNGVSTRKVDRLVEQLGIAGMTKDRVSALCRALDEHVAAFRERPLEGAYPYLWLDAST